MPESEKLILHNDVFRKHELSARHAGLLFCVFIFSHLSETVLCCNQRTRPSSSGLIILHSCKWHLKLRLYVHFKSEIHTVNMKQVHIWTHALHLNQHWGRLAWIWTPLSVLTVVRRHRNLQPSSSCRDFGEKVVNSFWTLRFFLCLMLNLTFLYFNKFLKYCFSYKCIQFNHVKLITAISFMFTWTASYKTPSSSSSPQASSPEMKSGETSRKHPHLFPVMLLLLIVRGVDTVSRQLHSNNSWL